MTIQTIELAGRRFVILPEEEFQKLTSEARATGLSMLNKDRERVSVVDSFDIPSRLNELRTLKDGWLEGKGKSPSLDGLDWLSAAFAQRYPADLVLPHIYPTAEGGVQAEWTLKPFDVSLEIDLGVHKGAWHSLNLQTGDEDSTVLDLNDGKSWIWVAAQIKQMARGAA